MKIRPVVVTLPNLYERPADRISLRVQHTAGQMSNLTHGRRDVVVDNDQIIIRVERQLVWVKRTLHLSRRDCQFVGKCAANREHGSEATQAYLAQESSAMWWLCQKGETVCVFHGWDPFRSVFWRLA